MIKRKVLLSEEWIATTRFEILRIQLPEGRKWVNGRPTKVQDAARLHTIWPQELCTLSTKKNTRGHRDEEIRLQETLRKGGIFIQRYRKPHGDLQRTSKTRKVHGSFNAVYFQRGMFGETRRYADAQMLGKPEALKVSKKRRDCKHHKSTRTASPKKRIRFRCPQRYGAEAHRCKRCDDKSGRQVRSRQGMVMS